MSFDEHYVLWRENRIQVIEEYYTPFFFKDKTLLELGSGYGDIGAHFSNLGAIVTCVEGRPEHIEIGKKKYPNLNFICADLEKQTSFGYYDIILNMGVLYHIRNIKETIMQNCNDCSHMVLESEVINFTSLNVFFDAEEGYDQAINGYGSRFSTYYIENILNNCNVKYIMCKDGRLNHNMHSYDWEPKNTKDYNYNIGQRAFWFIEREI